MTGLPAWISFDCYGTLIDWESGILATLAPLLRAKELAVSADAILGAYARAESAAESGAFSPYAEVLRRTMVALAADLGFVCGHAEAQLLADSVAAWPPFPDSASGLARLREAGVRLAILSNVDNDMIEHSCRRLDFQPDLLVTAQELRSYKPALAHFERARETIGDQSWWHLAQSGHHDLAPAQELGLTNVRIRRPNGREQGAVPEATLQREPDQVFDTLAQFVEAHLS